MTTAFVLGGGGVLGAVEVGMLRALLERGIVPDLVLGTSVGALNGALVAREPSTAVIEQLTALWQQAGGSQAAQVYGDSALPSTHSRMRLKSRLCLSTAPPITAPSRSPARSKRSISPSRAAVNMSWLEAFA